MRKLSCAAVALLWYLDILGTGQTRTIFGGFEPFLAAHVQPATLGPYSTLDECHAHRAFYELHDVVTLWCRAEAN